MKLLEIFRRHRRRRALEQRAGRGRLRKRDHVAQRARAGELHRDAIEAKCDTAVRRRAVAQPLEQKAESALRRFLVDQRQHESARKRSAPLVGDDALDRIADEDETPDAAFTRAWLGTVIGHAMNRLQDEWIGTGKREQFEQLAPLLEHADPHELQALAIATGMRSNTLAVQVHRMRQRLRELVRLELLQTVGSHEALEQELAELRGVALPAQ